MSTNSLRVLALDTKKYRRRQRWTLVAEMLIAAGGADAVHRPLALVRGGPGPRLTAYLVELLAADDGRAVIGVVIDGADALRRSVEAALAQGGRTDILVAANAFHLAKGANAVVLAQARAVWRAIQASAGRAGRRAPQVRAERSGDRQSKLPAYAQLLCKRAATLKAHQRPLVQAMLDADPPLAVLYDYVQHFTALLDRTPALPEIDATVRAIRQWANTPPPGFDAATKACRHEVRRALPAIRALYVLRWRTGWRVSTGSVEALQQSLATRLAGFGGRAGIRQGLAAVMARRRWSTDELDRAASSLASPVRRSP